MDLDSENVEENEKYSFLLGSAIRNEDPDQFLSIYDAILPNNLTDKQIDYIKDKARGIADLPDEEFNHLVLNARDYSLAKGREKMSFGTVRSSRLRHNDDDTSSDEDEVVPQKIGIKPPSIPFFSDSDHCIVDIEQVEKRTDNDSGIYNSSKATTSIGSYSDHDDSEGDDRGCFDYFPTQPSGSVKISQPCKPSFGYNLEYDEAHEVESDKNSQNDIESPRSDNSFGKDSDTDVYRGVHMEGTEMKTFRIQNNESDDFQTDDDSDEDVRINPHQRLYRGRTTSNYYTPMQLESTEDYNGYSYGQSTFSFDSSKKALQDRSASSLRGVDESVNFPIYSRYQKYNRTDYGSTSSDSVHVEKSVFSRDRPPFGHGTDQLNKVGSSIDSLISRNQSASNMPEGRHISSLDLASDIDSKKKKKKKRNSKDDLDDKGKRKDYSDFDENGNPLRNFFSSADKVSGAYRQMREPPRSTHGGAIVSSSKNRSPTSPHDFLSFPSEFSHFNSHSIGGQQVKDLEESQQSNQDRKRKKVKKEKGVLSSCHSEDIDNYVGDKKQIDELVDFIENDGTKKSKKLNSVSASDNNSLSNSKTTDTKNKKNKEKKQVSIGTKSVDNKYNIGEIIKDKKSEEEDKSETVHVTIPDKVIICELEKDPVLNSGSDSIMGNSQGRNSENEEKTSISKDLKSEKSKLQINDKIMPSAIEDFADIENVKNMQVDQSSGDSPSSDSEMKSVEKNSVAVESKSTNDVSATIANNNKKNKSKTTNNNKMEIKTAGSTNNVKQNNMKNFKSSDIRNDATKVLNTANCVLPVEEDNDTAEHVVPNNYYIFTDIDPLPVVEVEFTEVRKKKKKPVPVAPVREFFIREPINHKPIVPKEERRNNVPVRSVTPPPYHNFTNIQSIQDDQRVRDLSPSSFPALDRGNQRKSSFRDGRRNSTGDVPTEVLLKVQDDSDLESVKSLPASQSGCANQATSPRLPVSYAKMAASPRPSETSLASVKTDDSSESFDSCNVCLVPTVWKGEPTERRHSIGSSPKNSKENNQTSIPARQKCGSQENIKITGEEMPIISSENVRCDDESMDKDTSESLEKFKSVTESVSTESVPTEFVPTDSVPNSSESNPKDITVAAHSPSSIREKDVSNVTIEDDLHKTNTTSCVKIKQKITNGPKNNVSVTVKQTNDGKKYLKSKSVIFLDKRLNDVPQNLGITFGFDHQESNTAVQKDDSGAVSSSPHNSSSSVKVSNNDIPLSSPSSSVTVIEQCVSNSTSKDGGDQSNEKLQNSKMDSKHSLAGKNGVVTSYSHLAYKNHHVQSGDSTTITFEGSDASAKISSDSDVLKKGHKFDHILVCYGELPPISPNDSENKPSKQLKFLQETGHNDFGIFNYTDAINFLNKEWNNVLSQQKRNPDHVKVYNEAQTW